MRKIIPAMNAYIDTTDLLKEDGWIFEPKLDGFRAILYVNNSLTFLSRNNLILNSKFPSLLKIRKNIKAKNCILDGEIIAVDENGTPRMSLLGINPPIYVVFDILMKNGKILTSLPLMERKKILEETIENGKKIKKIFFSNQGKSLWATMLKKHFEGLMAKQINSKYYPGERKKVWLKIKNLNTADCVIIGYTITDKRELSSLLLGLYDNNHQLKYIGKVGTGFTQEMITNLLEIFKDYRSNEKPIDDIVKLKNVQWLKPHFVCEIAFLEFTKDNKIRHSAFKGMRLDKKPKQCTMKANIP